VSPGQRFYLFGRNGVGAAFANAVINCGFGWAMTHRRAVLPLWGTFGIAGDLAGTAFGVTFGTCLFMAVQVRWEVSHGKIEPIRLSPATAALIVRFPTGALRRGVGLGALSVPLFALPVVVALIACGVHGMSRLPFLVLKSGFAAFEGGVVTPLIVLAALCDLVRPQPERPPTS
jgi:hypothetical protein